VKHLCVAETAGFNEKVNKIVHYFVYGGEGVASYASRAHIY